MKTQTGLAFNCHRCTGFSFIRPKVEAEICHLVFQYFINTFQKKLVVDISFQVSEDKFPVNSRLMKWNKKKLIGLAFDLLWWDLKVTFISSVDNSEDDSWKLSSGQEEVWLWVPPEEQSWSGAATWGEWPMKQQEGWGSCHQWGLCWDSAWRVGPVQEQSVVKGQQFADCSWRGGRRRAESVFFIFLCSSYPHLLAIGNKLYLSLYAEPIFSCDGNQWVILHILVLTFSCYFLPLSYWGELVREWHGGAELPDWNHHSATCFLSSVEVEHWGATSELCCPFWTSLYSCTWPAPSQEKPVIFE